MSQKKPGFVTAVVQIARVELQVLRGHPGVWLFLPLIALNATFDAIYSLGAFETPLLLTPGRSAVGSLSELTFMLLLFLMVFTVEALRREERTRLSRIAYSAPISTRALICGKLLATSLLGLMPGYLGLAVNHAFAFGVPVVSQASPDPAIRFHSPEAAYVQPGENGLLARPNDAAAMLEAVERVLADRPRFSQNAYAYARTYLTLDQMVNGLEAAIRFVETPS